jgi:hypothetical protein
MAAITRQSSLLVQSDWTKIYQTFRNADFQSYDYDTLRKSMIDYLRTYYPEDFTDFTDSSEYIALIDLIAFLGQSLAFRTDLNARENFIDTAERRDSILKLARMISYNPKRNTPATGYLKFNSISSTETIMDSNGLNLANLLVSWDDASNENWQEQFTTVINASLVNTQVVGKPGARSLINGITTDEYGVSVVATTVPVFKFAALVEGNTMTFEAVSATSYDQNYIYEKDPRPTGVFNMLYRNDNQGNSSANTGFFLYFKQGDLKSLDFAVNDSLPNRVVNINYPRINNTDTWLYSLSTQNIVDTQWAQVPTVAGLNIIYNQSNQQNLFQVNTTRDDQIDLVFGDGAFAAVPQGNFRFFYRQSNGLEYKITPDEMQAVSIRIPYVSRNNRAEILTIVADLNYTVANASAAESIESIRTKAPQQYYTQNRMITGEDYNTLPYTSFNDILKVKTVNRTSSGISRYLDVMDTSGKYSSTNIFSDDGLIYKNYANSTSTFTYNTNSDVNRILYNVAKPMISSREISHLFYDSAVPIITPVAVWTQTLVSSGTSVGYFNAGEGIATATASDFRFLDTGALLKFVPPAGYYFNKDNQLIMGSSSVPTDKMYIYAAVNQISGIRATLSQVIPTGAVMESLIPKFVNDWSTSLVTSMSNKILANKNFGVRYNIQATGVVPDTTWVLVDASSLSLGTFDASTAGTQMDSSWYLAFTYQDGQYTITQRNLYYYAESATQTRFYFDPQVKVYDSNTGLTVRDHVKVLRSNSQPDNNAALAHDQLWYIYDSVLQPDGYRDTQKILVTFPDANNDGIPDDPTLFTQLVSSSASVGHVFFERVVDYSSFIKYQVLDSDRVVTMYSDKNSILNNSVLYQTGQLFYATAENKFYVSGNIALVEDTNHVARLGRQDIYFQYRHNSPNNRRIDPSPNNIMDLYILTRAYYTSYAAWVRDTSNRVIKPVPPTTEQLRTSYSSLENLKALSDTIIYDSVKFKLIFGSKADEELRATFKIVKNSSITISDNDVKAQVVAAINSYFEIANWDFGETFYFSELSAYLHNQLTPNVSSIIMVPNSASAQFGGLYQINAEANEIIQSAATVDNVAIINAITASQLNQSAAGLNTL